MSYHSHELFDLIDDLTEGYVASLSTYPTWQELKSIDWLGRAGTRGAELSDKEREQLRRACETWSRNYSDAVDQPERAYRDGELFLSEFELTERLTDRYSSADVWRARQKSLHSRPVVLRIVPGAVRDEWVRYARTPHAATAALYDVRHLAASTVLVLQDVAAPRADEVEFSSPRDVAAAARKLADFGLNIHGAGVVHCDLSPRNIHIEPTSKRSTRDSVTDCNLKVVDLGAYADRVGADAVDPLVPTTIITPGFTPLEQLSAVTLTFEQGVARDIFSVGAMMYALLAKKPLWRSTDTKPADLKATVSALTVDVQLRRIVAKAVAPVEERFETMEELRDALDDYESRKLTSLDKGDAWLKLRLFAFRHRLLLVSAVACVVAALALLGSWRVAYLTDRIESLRIANSAEFAKLVNTFGAERADGLLHSAKLFAQLEEEKGRVKQRDEQLTDEQSAHQTTRGLLKAEHVKWRRAERLREDETEEREKAERQRDDALRRVERSESGWKESQQLTNSLFGRVAKAEEAQTKAQERAEDLSRKLSKMTETAEEAKQRGDALEQQLIDEKNEKKNTAAGHRVSPSPPASQPDGSGKIGGAGEEEAVDDPGEDKVEEKPAEVPSPEAEVQPTG